MSILQEFKAFAMRGNVVDLAVGIIIGGAFGKIVSSLVENVVMPPIGLIIGGVDFSDLKMTLKEAAGTTPAVYWEYGKFVQSCVDFTIVAFAVFLLVKLMNRMKKEAPAAPAEPTGQEKILIEIRDLLKRQG